MAKVYYAKTFTKSFLENLKKELKTAFKGCKKIAVKMHFGEPGNKHTFTPNQIKPVINLLNELGIDFFLFDSSVAYISVRNNPITHKAVALKKGFGKLGKVDLGDGFIEVKTKNLTYRVCNKLTKADGVLVLSHFKGHYCSGFGGAIKNLGMGALTKKTKKDIHAGGEAVFKGKCTQCKACENSCPIHGIKVDDKRPRFLKCYGCSNCTYACPWHSIKPKINFFDVLLAEGATVAQKKFKKYYYVSVANHISKYCDCGRRTTNLISKNIGVFSSKDGVAIDKACYDLVVKEMKKDVFLINNKKTGLEHVNAAEKLGMGKQKYVLAKFR